MGGGGGVESHWIEPLQKKAIRLITNSNYSAAGIYEKYFISDTKNFPNHVYN